MLLLFSISCQGVADGNSKLAVEDISNSKGTCYGFVCLGDDYDKAKLPPPVDCSLPLPAPCPVKVKVSPILFDVYGVNDNDFTISFEVVVKFNWVDNRLWSPNLQEKRDMESGDINPDLLNHIWVPRFLIRNMKEVEGDTSGLFPSRQLNIIVKDLDVWLDMWIIIKPTITCNMRFNWYPFDEQFCNFEIQSIADDSEVVFLDMDNPGKFAKDALVQRALLDYDPKVKYLPEENRIADLGTGFDSWRDLYNTKTPT